MLPSTDERALLELFPVQPEDHTENVIFALTYVQHGGSGMTWTRRDVLDMEYQEAVKSMDRLQEGRRRDAAALRKAGRGKR
jgi:hypothetical protein